jgi:hypothetical protein
MHQFVVMWDQEGLEYIGDYTEYAQAKTWAVLSNTECPATFPNLMHLELRARYNSQRHYEIYIVGADESVSVADLKLMFESDPQTAADLIRKRGHCVYSDRVNKKQIRIV